MNDAQLISLVIALAVTPLTTLTVVLFGRSSEQKYIKAEIALLDVKFEARIDRLESALLSRMGELDTRLARLEAR